MLGTELAGKGSLVCKLTLAGILDPIGVNLSHGRAR